MQYPPNGNPQQPYGQQSYPGFVSQPLQPGYAQSGQIQPPPFIPPTQMPKKPKRWPWIIALIVVFFIGLGIGSGTHSGSDTPVATTQPGGGTTTQATSAPAKPTTPPKPTAVPKWVTTHTFTGNGSQKTATFTAPDDWKLNWSCNLATSAMGGQYNVIIDVTSSDGTPLDPGAINTLCKTGNTSGTTEERQGGSVYLDVTSEDNWTITVQELK